MKLYQITEELSALSDNLSSLIADDTLDPTIKATAMEAFRAEMDALSGTHAEKCLNVACLIKNVEAEGEAIAAEEKRLNSRRKSAERHAEWLRLYLAGNMEPGTNLKDARAVIGWRKSTAVEIECKPEELPENLRRTKTIIEPDKTAIKVAIEGGKEVDGCKLVTRHNIQIK